jgi:hypothetical protein
MLFSSEGKKRKKRKQKQKNRRFVSKTHKTITFILESFESPMPPVRPRG